MNFLFPLAHIVFESIGKIIDKLNFTKNKVGSRQIVLLVFLGMVISLALFIVFTKEQPPAFTYTTLGLIGLIAAISFIANLLDFASLKRNDLSLREPLLGFEPIIAGLVGYILFPEERHIGYLIAFFLGGLIVYWGTHRRKLRAFQRKGLVLLLFALFLYSLLPSVYNLALEYISPAWISLFRAAAILGLTALFLPMKKMKKISSRQASYGLASGLMYAIGTVASLYTIKVFGVVLAMLLLLLGPVLRYLASYFILNENVRKGEVVSSALLAAVVLGTVFLK